LAFGQQAVPPAAAKDPGNESVITLQEAGKPDFKVKVLRKYKTADGKIAYEVQDLATGEKMTLTESGSHSPEAASPSRFGKWTSKLFHLGRSTTSPAPAAPPAPPKGPGSTEPPLAKSAKDDKASEHLAANDIPAEPAPPTDWHQSWGKADDHLTARTVADSSAQIHEAAKRPLPAAAPPEGPEETTASRRVPPAEDPGPALPDKGPAARSRPVAPPPPPKEDPPAADAPPLDPLLVTLRDHLLPSRRQVAAETLSTSDWHRHPEVVTALVQAAREDPAASVRAACVRCLGRMSANTEPVLAALQALKADPDPDVRHEAEAALAVLGAQGK
jgi:hypothetical protein